ncbi:MAG: response regulator [Verrucomicrobiota bacterium]|nr:response regulator [Verrucomicrobiota bacterium]
MDDDPDWLDVCREALSQLPSKPQIRTTNNGPRALAMLDAAPFRLMICDLKLPKMDGIQVLSLVHKRYPDLRTVVLTGLEGEEIRSRSYSLGVDLFWLKHDMQQNPKMFSDCIESLLGRESNSGFRGIQSKSLMDIIQLECMSRNSTALRITQGPLVAKIWIQDGELLDAQVGNMRGEPAFQKILAWKSGTFENLPAEPDHERTISRSINALLLETAQAIDETAETAPTEMLERADHRKTVWRLSLMAGEGAEFVVSVPAGGPVDKGEVWGAPFAEQLAGWTRKVSEAGKHLGDRLEAGPLSHIAGCSAERNMVMLSRDDKLFLVAWPPSEAETDLLEKTKKLVASWES